MAQPESEEDSGERQENGEENNIRPEDEFGLVEGTLM